MKTNPLKNVWVYAPNQLPPSLYANDSRYPPLTFTSFSSCRRITPWHSHKNSHFPVITKPPYSVKESGYAGFNLPVEIYLQNKDEPKKLKFNYDLHLQPQGPTFRKVQKEKYVFNSPREDFKLKLLKGGGTVSPLFFLLFPSSSSNFYSNISFVILCIFKHLRIIMYIETSSS